MRTLFGANNKEVGAPAFMSGTFSLGGLQITYGRMWIIIFAICVFFALQAVLRATPFGLKMRAVTQNRRMASAMGIDTNRIDALAFGLGSGIAGIAGVALSQIDNVSPNLGQGYIIDSFLVVVFGGVGNLWGTLVAALTLGVANKFMEPVIGAVLGKIALLVFIILFIQKRPRGLFALKGPRGGSVTVLPTPFPLPRRAPAHRRRSLLLAAAILVPVLALTPETFPLHLPAYLVPLFGKYLCYAILAVALDLVWGYCGILSLGHGAFFALGGYAMGMYLMRQIGTRGVYADPVLPDFMVFLNWKDLPVTWWGFQYFPYALLMVLLVPGILAYVFGWFAFRSRVTGVYLSIITQAMTYALWLAFFRNDMGFGGNNGLTDFKDILGFNIQAPGTRIALFVLSALMLVAALSPRPVRHDVEIRQGADRHPRCGIARAVRRLPRRELQARDVHAVGDARGHRGRAVRAAGRHHQSERIRAGQFDRGGRVGRRRRTRHAGRCGTGRDHRQFRQDAS